MFRKNPPIIKIYESLGAIADEIEKKQLSYLEKKIKPPK